MELQPKEYFLLHRREITFFCGNKRTHLKSPLLQRQKLGKKGDLRFSIYDLELNFKRSSRGQPQGNKLPT